MFSIFKISTLFPFSDFFEASSRKKVRYIGSKCYLENKLLRHYSYFSARVRHESAVASSSAVLAGRERLQAGRCFPTFLSVAGSRFTAFRVALTGRVPGAQWTRLHSVDETIIMCGIYDYRARRVLFAVQL